MRYIPVKIQKYKASTRALVDDDVYNILIKHKWHQDHYGYAVRSESRRSKIKMHRIVVNASKGDIVDHIDGNVLNNQKQNLRICSHAQNIYNSKMHKTNTSGFRGVDYLKEAKHNPWRARYSNKNRTTHIGVFSTKEEAARAYDEKIKELRGEFARTNF